MNESCKNHRIIEWGALRIKSNGGMVFVTGLTLCAEGYVKQPKVQGLMRQEKMTYGSEN